MPQGIFYRTLKTAQGNIQRSDIRGRFQSEANVAELTNQVITSSQ
jgi:hypothetical protein